MTDERILVSFSGGRTSARLAKLIKQARPSANVLYIFSNTGLEDTRTLTFVDRCDREYDLDLVWVEAEVDPRKGFGTTFRRVTYETASRNGEPFEAAIAKYGLPNKNYPWCNRELKLAPIHAYARSIGWATGTYRTLIGIRADEIDRMSVNAKKKKISYPLVSLGVTKSDVLSHFKSEQFDLYVEEERGNCVTCWKKSLRKLMTIAVKTPDDFEFFRRMEKLHSFTGPGKFEDGPRKLFREKRTVADIFEQAKQPFEPFNDGNYVPDPSLDSTNGCGDSCDIFADDNDEYQYIQELLDDSDFELIG